ncbi:MULTISPECIES: LytTR family DNA-binding domain-containing protein [unclassified Flammeovirga]|uniref:LytR/AlgR family response regulator transcription factor n=1 Tax=unclassified Flammeovirga TaxID=2637820 RepID=UPI000787A2EA|nr:MULTISPECIES: LytTR family DNA-binding domain-containing protein [unclassified Flammeovirga]KXX69743.1 two-component system response regulator [Flammeovirga sp. SJP92]MBD0403606.1 response regulator transcription factor [Flammeovirga sp. EKP202]
MQRRYNCLIVDDEQLARTLLSAYIEKIPHLEVIGSCKSPLEAMNYLREGNVDILFLDIQMPELNGVDFLKTIAQQPAVIFTTAYAEYAVTSYELDAVDYLLKPFGFDRFVKAVNKAIEKVEAKNTPSDKKEAEEVLYIKGDQKIYKVEPSSILYIEGLKEYVSYFIENQQRIISLHSLTKLEKELAQYNFMRVHRSYIVNLNHVTAFERHALWIDKEEIPIGKTYRDTVKEKLNW